MKQKFLPRFRIATILVLVSACYGAVDENGNQLSDVWEQRFDASALTPSADEDGDGFSNLEESVAGTDPFEVNSKPQLLTRVSEGEQAPIELSFETVEGKEYEVSQSLDLQTFEVIISGWLGEDADRVLEIQRDGMVQTKSPVKAEYWADLGGDTIDTLYNSEGFLDAPDGTLYLNGPQAPVFLAADYGARIRFWVTPTESGLHSFFLSSGGPAELFFGEESNLEDLQKIAEILPTQNGLAPLEWETYGSQRSDPIELTAGERYFMDLRYLAVEPGQHAQIAWVRPGVGGIEIMDRDDLSVIYFHAPTAAETPLLVHDYDSPGQTGTLWPRNTTIETSANPGILNYERVSGALGSGDRILFSSMSSDHLYASWTFDMATDHEFATFIFGQGTDGSREGPQVRLEALDSGTVAAIRAGGVWGGDSRIDVAFDKVFRLELVATTAQEGFTYYTPSGPLTVAQDRFDFFVSDLNGNLIDFRRGLMFRDGEGVVQNFSSMRLANLNAPDIGLDNFEITGGSIAGNAYLVPNQIDFGSEADHGFFRLRVNEDDQDEDGIADWEELALANYYELLFFDGETLDGTPDSNALSALLSASQGPIEIALFATDAAAYESNFPNTIPDDGEITIIRSGALTPVTVNLCIAPLAETGNTATVCDGSCCSLVGSAGDEEAEIADYQLIDEDGRVIIDTVHFEFGETSKVLTLKAVNDDINEYPETVNLAIEAASDDSYTISTTQNGASIQIFDLPDSPDNLTIFTGTFSQDGAASVASGGSGFISATLNGPRTELRVWSEFSGLTSAQQDAHIHKSGSGPTPGPIIYEITETPGDPETDPLNGPLVSYPWDISDSSGAIPTAGGAASKQVIIDSLFGQNGETPLYLNIHTVDNPAGEIWAFFGISGGNAQDPGDAAPAAAPGTSGFPQLADALLEADVRRFLNQATFGATDADVNALLASIEQERQSDPNFHRATAFSEWIDEQINAVDQTYLLEYTLATHYQFMTLAHIFDPVINADQSGWETPEKPTDWPSINRDSADPNAWYLDDVYPVDRDDFRLGDANGLVVEPGNIQRRQAHYQLMIGAHDQLRQKMGFALQQIVVVSDILGSVERSSYGSANYQDMLNYYAFEHYRDILGFVNWSPLMGKWLSSLQNQKAIDFDGDGLYDAFPDENLARENMQLFSIGLFDIWSDGSLKLSPEGLPRSTYTNDDIREFAKILTGQSFSRHNRFEETWGGDPFVADNNLFEANQNGIGILGVSYLYPMKMFGDYHSLGSKTFAGLTIDNTDLTDPTAQGIADIEDAIDWLAGKPDDGLPDFDMVNSHVSTPAFISRRLIQRFTTSNPSDGYLHRVSTVFKNTEGDLEQTLRAILLDPEVRTIDLQDSTFGMKKSPLEAYLQLVRAMNAYTHIPIYDPQGAAPFDVAPGDFTNPELYLEAFEYPADQLDNHERNARFMPVSGISSGARGIQMDPFRQPTVFNYYLPDFSPGGVIGAAGLVAPEMQLANEPDTMRNINLFENLVRSPFGEFGDELGGTDDNQVMAFGDVAAAVDNDAPRLDRQALADAFYPATEPADAITVNANGLSESTFGSPGQAPRWVRIRRTGNSFVMSESTNGTNWSQIDTFNLPMASEVFVGLAVTSHENGTLTTANFSNVSITGSEGVWYSTDIGAVAAAGSFVQTAPESFEIQASGTDIWGANDQFHFVFQHLTGNGTITARVDSLVQTDQWAKAGVMIRETLEPDSANVYARMSAARGSHAQIRRVERGRSSESFADEALLDALDLRLTNGLFKLRYPYDVSDNDDPSVHGVDELLKNPREMIIDAITAAYDNAFDGPRDAQDRLNKLSDALFLLTISPEYQIKK